jgi:hypothetical protein
VELSKAQRAVAEPKRDGHDGDGNVHAAIFHSVPSEQQRERVAKKWTR